MNRLSATFALVALLAGGVVGAQTPASPDTTPSASQPKPSATQNSQSGKEAQMKQCLANERANNPQISEQAATEACKEQLNRSPRG